MSESKEIWTTNGLLILLQVTLLGNTKPLPWSPVRPSGGLIVLLPELPPSPSQVWTIKLDGVQWALVETFKDLYLNSLSVATSLSLQDNYTIVFALFLKGTLIQISGTLAPSASQLWLGFLVLIRNEKCNLCVLIKAVLIFMQLTGL